MAITINGTSGITTPELTLDNTTADGGQVVLKSSGYDNWNIDNYNGRLRAYNGSTERMTIDTSGNVGIGTSTIAPASGKNLQIGDRSNIMQLSVNNGLYFGNNLYYDGSTWRYNQTGVGSYMHCDTGAVAFGTAPSGTAGSMASSITERLRIDSAGSTIVGVSSNSGQMTVRGSGISYPNAAAYMGFSPNSIGMAWTSPNIYASVDNATYAVIGTVSDYRLKANSAPLENGLQTVLALRPITYNPVEFDGTVKENKTELGLIAHEVQAIRPSVVIGEKDAVNEEGNPRYQSVNYAGLVPDLIKAIQEQQAIISDLKARIETLENK